MDLFKKRKITIVVFCILLIVIFFTFGAIYLANSEQKDEPDRILTEGPTNEPTSMSSPTPTNEIVPTKQLLPTNMPTPTSSPTNTPSPTVAPTSVPTNTPTPTPLPPDTAPPVITEMSGPQNNSTVNFNSFCFPMTISDDRSLFQNFWTQYQFDSSTWTDWNNSNDKVSPCFQNVSNDQHVFSVHAKDEAGNISETITRAFNVQVQ